MRITLIYILKYITMRIINKYKMCISSFVYVLLVFIHKCISTIMVLGDP
jgi:hypothetical protein